MATDTRNGAAAPHVMSLLLGRPLAKLDVVVGGPARRRVVLTLAAVLAVSSADQATIGAIATQLRAYLHIDHSQFGLLAAVTGLVGAIATIPAGVLIDRFRRTRVVAIAVASWAVVMGGSALTHTFLQLVLVRCALGVAVAVAGPATASLIGDFFAPGERGRIWGYVIAGELVGAGFGFTVSGNLAALTWRASFAALALPAVVLAMVLWRLPEPLRGGRGRLPVGATRVESARRRRRGVDAATGATLSAAQEAARAGETAPHDDLVLDEDPQAWPLWRAVRYVLRIRTNVTLIIAGAMGYFFFAGARAFGVEFVKSQYGVGQGFASMLALVLGAFAIVGVVAGGWFSDRAVARGHITGRIRIGAIALAAAVVLFVPALLVTSAAFGVLALGAAAMCLAAINPPLDAARLDIMHPTLWGRAEAVRSALRQPAEAAAPLLFGVLADRLDGTGNAGLRDAFLLMLLPLALTVGVLLLARRSYPRDVATAAESIQRTCR